ncbi:methyl-accepting chemotaxis protein [Pantoea sp. B9002]|uniref:methyl-accepting chemotaxis protein n=1 Tax=Pantoea sp. B9002 TaxID=2726979 RepID=UPI002105A531|nr:methyl-accepting chemotaxis protein [Pantoea sp. B9002]
MIATPLSGPVASPLEMVSLTLIAQRADSLAVILSWALLPIALGVGWLNDSVLVALSAGLALALLATFFGTALRGTLTSRLVLSALLIGWAGLLIQVGGGATEYHFSVFVLMSALLAWRDVRPLLMGAAAAATHHVLFNYLQENDLFGVVVFHHPGWDMVFFHALFVVVQTAMLLVIARQMAADARSASEVAQLAAHINQQAGYLTLSADTQQSETPFARTFSTTLGTMHGTLHQVSDGVGQLLAESDSILERNAALSTRTDEQAQALEVAASAMTEISIAASLTRDKAQSARELASETRAVATRGEENIQSAIRSMEKISEESRRVKIILELIDGIAFQTNILSLNASVEAARAGNQGRGFAVVASEVRNLAMRSESAAREIRQLMDASSTSTEHGTVQVEHAAQTMREIHSSISGLSQLVTELSEMSEQQNLSIEQIQQSINSIDHSVHHNVQHVAETLQVAQQQQQQANALKQAISLFRLG